MKMDNAFLFQGVGTEYRNYLNLLSEDQLDSLHAHCKSVESLLSIDIWTYLFESKLGSYEPYFYQWLSIYSIDFILSQNLIYSGAKPSVISGYSLGLITAMACSSSISFETGIILLHSIYEYLNENILSSKGAMIAIIGLEYAVVKDLILQVGDSQAGIAIKNNQYCFIVSGESETIEYLTKEAMLIGAIKVVRLDTNFAFHTARLECGIEKFTKCVMERNIRDSTIPILSAIDQRVLTSSKELESELIKNMSAPLDWHALILKIGSMGVNSFIEVSLDSSITKTSKMINSQHKFYNYSKYVSSSNGVGNGVGFEDSDRISQI